MNEESDKKTIIDNLNKALNSWENKNSYGNSLEELERRYNLYMLYAVAMDLSENKRDIEKYNIYSKIKGISAQINDISPEKAANLYEKTKLTLPKMTSYLTTKLETCCQTQEEKELYENCVTVIVDYMREFAKYIEKELGIS